jgi:hypothetical protein
METGIANLEVTYFPYTFLDPTDLKRLILYFESVRLLQVSPNIDPELPALLHSSPLVQSFCPITSSSFHETTERALLIHRQLGDVLRDGGLVQLLRSLALQEDLESSRTSLVAHLREAHPRLTQEQAEVVNNAVFLLLAHDFDREHLELDLKLDHIRGLETKLHREAGIGTDDGIDTLAMESPLLMETDRPRTQYPLQRLRAWTHLYSSQDSPGPFLPVTTCVEVLEEIAERVPLQQAERSGGWEGLRPEHLTLAILPDPRLLSLEETLELRRMLSNEVLLEKWWEAVADAIIRVQRRESSRELDRDLQQHLKDGASAFQQNWPSADTSGQFLRLEAVSYPGLMPPLAFAQASGLASAVPTPDSSEATNGVALLLVPSPPP